MMERRTVTSNCCKVKNCSFTSVKLRRFETTQTNSSSASSYSLTAHMPPPAAGRRHHAEFSAPLNLRSSRRERVEVNNFMRRTRSSVHARKAPRTTILADLQKKKRLHNLRTPLFDDDRVAAPGPSDVEANVTPNRDGKLATVSSYAPLASRAALAGLGTSRSASKYRKLKCERTSRRRRRRRCKYYFYAPGDLSTIEE